MLRCKAESPLQLHFSLGCLGALAKAQSREGALIALLGRGQQAPCSEEVFSGNKCLVAVPAGSYTYVATSSGKLARKCLPQLGMPGI